MYQRYLRNSDYQRSISLQHFNQCFDLANKPYKIDQCEMDAEIKVIEHLSQMYAIEKELAKGKSISDYDKRILYSEGSYFWYDDKICRAIKNVLGVVRPEAENHWVEVEVFDIQDIPIYSQFGDYEVGDIVLRKEKSFQCVVKNGYSYDNIRIPYTEDIKHWELLPHEDYIERVSYPAGTFVQSNGSFYLLETLDGYDSGIDPSKLSCFKPITAHSDDLFFKVGDYSSYNGNVFKALVNVNPDAPELRVNIVNSDPRNYNLIKHMIEISLYQAFKEFSPNNISQVRVNSYAEAEVWLKEAAKLRIDPKIERKVDKQGSDEMPHVMGKFVNESSYVNNQWAL